MTDPNEVVTPTSPVIVPPEALLPPVLTGPVSPTGVALLPQLLIKAAVPLVAVAGAVAMLPESMTAAGWVGTLPGWVLVTVGVSKVLFALGAALGIASQGARKKGTS